MLVHDTLIDRPQRLRHSTDVAGCAAFLLAEHCAARSTMILRHRLTGMAVGYFVVECASGEIEYYIGKPYRKQGYASEALGALGPTLEELASRKRLFARTRRENKASTALLHRHAFRFDGLEPDDTGHFLARFVKEAWLANQTDARDAVAEQP